MCSNCFDTEIETFKTDDEFKNFEKLLEKKLRAADGMFYLRQGPPGELISYTIYSCKSCSSKWYLNVPVSGYSGCFLTEDNFQPLLERVKKNDSHWRRGVIITCLFVMFVCLLFLIGALN